MAKKNIPSARAVPEENAATPDEIGAAIEALTPAQLVRLKKFSTWRILGLGRNSSGRDHDDLLQEAITSTLAGNRRWNKTVDFERHLLGAMRSISSHWGEQADPAEPRLESEVIRQNSDGQEMNPILLVPSTDPNPERLADGKQRLDEIERLLAGDRLALDVVGGLRGEMIGPEIQEALGISQSEFETVVKRIYRQARAIIHS